MQVIISKEVVSFGVYLPQLKDCHLHIARLSVPQEVIYFLGVRVKIALNWAEIAVKTQRFIFDSEFIFSKYNRFRIVLNCTSFYLLESFFMGQTKQKAIAAKTIGLKRFKRETSYYPIVADFDENQDIWSSVEEFMEIAVLLSGFWCEEHTCFNSSDFCQLKDLLFDKIDWLSVLTADYRWFTKK